jgi:ketosteroid isomerase-like protein
MDTAKLRRGYRAFGVGSGSDLLALFDQDVEGGRATWDVGGPRSRLVTRAGTPAAYDLFGDETGWEIVRVEANDFTERGETIIVTGHVFWRPRGGWEIVPAPFCHIWTLRGGRPVRVLSYLDGIELRRVEER